MLNGKLMGAAFASLATAALATGTLAFIASPAVAEDEAWAETHYEGVCANCHGPTAKGMASFPKLSDKDAEYLTIQLEQYRAGETVGYNTALMAPHAAELSDAEIASLAAYISGTFGDGAAK